MIGGTNEVVMIRIEAKTTRRAIGRVATRLLPAAGFALVVIFAGTDDVAAADPLDSLIPAGSAGEVIDSATTTVIEPIAETASQDVDPLAAAVPSVVDPVVNPIVGVATPIVEPLEPALPVVEALVEPVISTDIPALSPVLHITPPAIEPLDGVEPSASAADAAQPLAAETVESRATQRLQPSPDLSSARSATPHSATQVGATTARSADAPPRDAGSADRQVRSWFTTPSLATATPIGAGTASGSDGGALGVLLAVALALVAAAKPLAVLARRRLPSWHLDVPVPPG